MSKKVWNHEQLPPKCIGNQPVSKSLIRITYYPDEDVYCLRKRGLVFQGKKAKYLHIKTVDAVLSHASTVLLQRALYFPIHPPLTCFH